MEYDVCTVKSPNTSQYSELSHDEEEHDTGVTREKYLTVNLVNFILFLMWKDM